MKRLVGLSSLAVGLAVTVLLSLAQSGGGIANVRRLNLILSDGTNCTVISGTGDPEGSVVGKPCDAYLRKDAPGWYVKDAGTGTDTSGWISASGSVAWSSVTSTPTTFGGYGIVDTFTNWLTAATATRSGNTAKVVTTTGTLTSGDCVEIDANGNFVASGAACAGGGGATTAQIGFTVDGAGSAITTGTKGFITVPYNCTITGVTVLSTDASVTSGSIVIDVWADSYANYPPTVADTITASAKPTLSSAVKSQDTTLTGWTTSLSAGDVIGFHVDSASTVTRVTLILSLSL